jgi:hypothetical protein
MIINEKENQDLNKINKIPLIPTPEGIRAMAKLGLKAVPPTPSGKPEFTDGTNWYYLATEGYVVNAISQVGNAPCIAATTANLSATYVNGTSGVGATLTSTVNQVFTIDGITPAVGVRILIKDQSTAFQNGIYTVTNVGSSSIPSPPWVLTRATDFDSPSQMFVGDAIFVATGTVNGVTAWMQTATVTTVGTSSITFVKLAKSGIESIEGTTNQITVNTSGSAATVSLATNPVLPGTASTTLPGGTTAQRPGSLVAGMIRYNNGS